MVKQEEKGERGVEGTVGRGGEEKKERGSSRDGNEKGGTEIG